MTNETDSWLSVPDIAQSLGITPTKVRQLVDERFLLGSRRTGVFLIPAAFVEGGLVQELPGTVTVLFDGGFTVDDALDWLLEHQSVLGASPLDALRAGRKKEVRRLAQALAV